MPFATEPTHPTGSSTTRLNITLATAKEKQRTTPSWWANARTGSRRWLASCGAPDSNDNQLKLLLSNKIASAVKPLGEAEVRSIAMSIARYEPRAEERAFSIVDIPSVWSFEQKIEWVIDGILPRSAITMVTGDSGVGKSTLAMDIAGRVANGGTFLGKPVIEAPVLYIDRENSLATVRERLDRLHVAETSRLKF